MSETTQELLKRLGIDDVNSGVYSDRWIDAPGGKELVSISPIDGRPLARVMMGDRLVLFTWKPAYLLADDGHRYALGIERTMIGRTTPQASVDIDLAHPFHAGKKHRVGEASGAEECFEHPNGLFLIPY